MGSRKVRVGLVGVGNCASSFVQGLSHYGQAGVNAPPPGLMNVDLGGYHVGDIEVVSAFDVARSKVGRDVAEAIVAPPNNTARFAEPAPTGVKVRRGPTLDGLGRYLKIEIEESPDKPVDVAGALQDSGAQVLVSYLPVGSQAATEFYAEQALQAGCAFVNCVPVFVASNPDWAGRFEQPGLPIIGDDIKSQVGATIVHRVLTNLFRERGVRLDRTFQLNVGGNTDFQNMLERERLEVEEDLQDPRGGEPARRAAGGRRHPYRPLRLHPLADRPQARLHPLEGTTFGDVPLSLRAEARGLGQPNSAGVVIDAVRCAKLGLDRGLAGPLDGPSSYFMKSPPRQCTDQEARERTRRFIEGAA